MGIFSFGISCVHTLAGLAAFITFMMMRFYAAAVFGIISATVSAVTAQLNWLHRKRRVSLWYEYNELNQFYWLGFWTFALGTSGFVYHLAALIVIKDLQIKLVVALIWGFFMLQSGCILMYTAHKYWKETVQTNLISPIEES